MFRKKPFLIYLALFVISALASGCDEPQPRLPTNPPERVPSEKIINAESLKDSLYKDIKQIDQASIETYNCLAAFNKIEFEFDAIDQENNTKTGTFNGCHDPLWDDITRQTSVYFFKEKVQGPLNQVLPKPEFDSCRKLADVCKGPDILVEQSCDGPALASKAFSCAQEFKDENEPYSCFQGACVPQSQLPENRPDLVVESIAPEVLSEKCANSFAFQICNHGGGPVDESFDITLSANNFSKTYPYDIDDQGPIEPGICKDIVDPPLFNTLGYGIGLDETHSVTVVVDTNGDVYEGLEESETNNSKTAEVFSGSDYMFDETLACDVTCYDTDQGKKPLSPGGIEYVFQGDANTLYDSCQGDTTLRERYCIPVFPFPDGTFPDPSGYQYTDCSIIFYPTPGKCQAGRCVEAEAFPACSDTDNGKVAAIKGTVQYTNPDNITENFTDHCKQLCEGDVCVDSEEFLREFSCLQGNDLKSQHNISCYNLPVPSVCNNGQCVPTDTDLRECNDSDPGDDTQVVGTVSFKKLLGEQDSHTDYCMPNKTGIKQFSCGGVENKDPVWNTVSCETVNPGWGCKDGICVAPDPELVSCSDSDAGLNFDAKGQYSVTDKFGYTSTGVDHCDTQSGLLIEYFCNDNSINLAPPHDCAADGKVCDNGACIEP